MVFSSAISLFFFVPIVFLLDRRLSNVDAKNTWLLLASLVFYSFGQVYYLPLLLLFCKHPHKDRYLQWL